MIDTIAIRLHGLNKHSTLIKQLELNNNKGYKIKTGKVEKEELERLRKAGYNAKQRMDIMEINRTGDFIVKTEVRQKLNQSHHYYFTYRINESEDYIHFEFSVPKYIHGSNVLQFVEHAIDVHYKPWDNAKFQTNIEKTPKYVIKFIKHFFWREFIYPVDFYDVEICRIDFCFNQVFRSKEDANQIFELTKNMHKKGSRDDEGTKRIYGSTIMYVTQGYSAKVYKKGLDYTKHELPEHKKINNERGFQYFETDKFQAIADRTLRFEITLRPSQINYLFKHHIFRKDCTHFKTDLRNYKRIDSTLQRNKRKSKEIGGLPEKEKGAYRKLYPYEHISKEDRNTHKYVSHLLSRKPRFMMCVNDMDNIANQITANFLPPVALFSEEIILVSLQKLFDFIKHFQIKDLPNEEIIALRIDQYNATHKVKLQKAKMFQVYALLVQYGSFREAIKASRFSKATLYRYINKFKLIEITENNIVPVGGYKIPEAAMDFKEYHIYLSFNRLVKKSISQL